MKSLEEYEINQHIKEWIRRTHNPDHGPLKEVLDDTDLIAAGILDSLGFIELMVFLEVTTEEKIDLNDVDPNEFTTIRGLCKSVLNQRGERTAAERL
jgi:acyl carrier protein